MTTLYLIRHAEAEGNLYRRIHGWYDALVTENGYRQISALQHRFEGSQVDAVYSSDLFRTRATAQALCAPRGLSPHTESALREVNMGDWEDLTWGEAQHFHPDLLRLFNETSPLWRAPGGESLEEAGVRMEQALRAIAQAHPDQTVAVFSHGTAIRQFLAQVKGLSPDQWHTLSHCDNTAVTCLAWNDNGFHIIYEGDNSHLDDSTSTLARQSWWRKDGKKAVDVNFWFRPLDLAAEQQVYLDARQDAWCSTHGSEIPFDSDGFLQDALLHASRSPWGVTCAMSGDEFAGIIQLDPERYRADGAGYIPFCYLAPQLRAKGLGVQLIGHAVSFYRARGRDRLRLRCAPYNTAAQRFYKNLGFYKIGEEEGSRVPLEILEKYIGYDRP